jgi:hypothetical protein
MKNKKGWDLAIQDARETITSLEKKIKRLHESIQVFENERDAGRLWPGNTELEVQREMALR